MPSHITVNGLGLTYKGTIGLSIATIPDVCKTPSPGGPIPLPYPNIATQSTLKDGTTTVLAKGGKMIAIKGSQYGMSSGDEPGTVGGVKSNVFKKATDWITYSFDVKMDGKNACRHTDKKFHNDKNTVNLAGDVDPVVAALPNFEKALCKMLKDCTTQVDKGNPDPLTKNWCNSKGSGDFPSKAAERGDAIDKCVEGKIQSGKAKSTTELSKQVQTQPWAPVPGLGGSCKPDVVVGTPPNCAAAYDIKTSCPSLPPNAPAPKWPVYGDGSNYTRFTRNRSWHGRTQQEVAGRACGVQPKMIHPNSETCK